MRNIFKKRTVAENSEEVVDMQPRGVHHTVSYRQEFNETWMHLREEIRNSSLPHPDELYVESRDIYSYNEEVSSSKRYVQPKISAVDKPIQHHCNVMKLTSGLFTSADMHVQEKQITECPTEVSQRKNEAFVSQYTATFDNTLTRYSLEAVDKTPQKNVIPDYHYEISIQKATICSFQGEISITSDYRTEELVSTVDRGFESETDGKLATEIVLQSYLAEDPKTDAHSRCGEKDGFTGRSYRRGKNRHRPEKPTYRLQNQRVKDRHRLRKTAKALQSKEARDTYRETVLAHAAINTFSLDKLGGLQ
ncbi:MAG: hypothetical protein RIG62_10055 [Cyclobacteriaceae bacterium]